MGNFKTLLLSLCLGTVSFANADVHLSQGEVDYYSVKQVKIVEIENDPMMNEVKKTILEQNYDQNQPFYPNQNFQNPTPSSSGSIGKIIAVGKDLIALGESVYKLVDKGRPSNQTTYAPISVLPRINGEYADIFETENWKAPKKKTYSITYTNFYGMDVVKFRYSVIFAYGGSFNGVGAYITSAQIIPESIMTSFGFDFTASMKLGGMTNIGTKANPEASIILTLEYTVETILQASFEADSYTLTGKGVVKSL